MIDDDLRDQLAKIHDRLNAIERRLALFPYLKVIEDNPDILYVVEAMRAQKAADSVSLPRDFAAIPVPQR
jgi:DNA-binding transcriptional regulator WhiA